jgi:hypothetical protein
MPRKQANPHAAPTLIERLAIYANIAREAAEAGRDIDASFGLIQALDAAREKLIEIEASKSTGASES